MLKSNVSQTVGSAIDVRTVVGRSHVTGGCTGYYHGLEADHVDSGLVECHRSSAFDEVGGICVVDLAPRVSGEADPGVQRVVSRARTSAMS